MDKASRESHPGSPAFPLLRAIAMEAIAACDPARAVERAVWAGTERLVLCDRTVRLRGKGRLLVVAFGKGASRMLEGLLVRLEQAGSQRTLRGLVVSPFKEAHSPLTGRRATLEWLRGEHPVPGRGSFSAGRRALRLMGRAGPTDDVIVLASGGGSSLVAAPLSPFITSAEKSSLHRLLVTSGAPIGSINTVRKHLSAVKGGRLGQAARRAASLTTLIACDVDPGGYEDVASGPSLPDRTTNDDMVAVIDRHGLAPALPVKVLEALRSGRLPETPKPGEAAFRRSRSQMILSNRDLRNAAVRSGLAHGLSAEALLTEITGPVAEAAELVARAIEASPPGTRLLIMGGEPLVAPSGPGTGGRAQELALRLALRMAGLSARPWAFLACGSDGVDGNSPAAGAFVDATTLARAGRARLDAARALRDSESYRFFKKLGNEITMAPSGTNVRDIYILLTGEPRPTVRQSRPSPPRVTS